MSDDKVSIVGPGDGSHAVEVSSLPNAALFAIIKKLNEKSQRATKSYRNAYDVSISDIKRAIDQVSSEFHNCQIISISASVSINLSNNQRFDFTSWQDFEDFDPSMTERTRALSTELVVTSRKVIWLFPEQLRLQFVPVLHRLQGCLAAQG